MNEKELREAVRAEFGGAQSSQLVDRRMREAYRMLEEQENTEGFEEKEKFRKKRPLIRAMKILGSTAGGLAAAFLILLGISVVNPALAAELPLIGGIFAQFNEKTGEDLPPSITEKVVERAVVIEPTVEPTASADETPENCPLEITLQEASCDGMSLNLAFSIACSNAEWNNKYTQISEARSESEEFQVTANGVKLTSSFCYWPVFTPSETPGVYTGIVACTLPEELRGEKNLDIQCCIPSLRIDTTPDKATMESSPGDAEISSQKMDWKTSFSLEVEPTFRTYTPNAEFGGIILSKVVLGDAALECTYIMPEDWNNRSVLHPLDDRGEIVSPDSVQTGMEHAGNGKKAITVFLSAPETETSTLTFQAIKYLDEYLGKSDDEIDPEITGTYTLELN